MHLDYASIPFDLYGNPEIPVLLLQKLNGEPIASLSNVSDIEITISFSEVSELNFQIAAYSDGEKTPYYDAVTGYKLIYTEHYGIFVIMNPEEIGDGL